MMNRYKEGVVKKKGKDMSLYDFILEDLAKLEGSTKYRHYRHKLFKLSSYGSFLDDVGYYPFGGCTVSLEFTVRGILVKYGVCNEADRFVKRLGRACAKNKKYLCVYLYEDLLKDILRDEGLLVDEGIENALDVAITPLNTFRRLIVQKAYQKADEGLKKAGFKEKTFYILK